MNTLTKVVDNIVIFKNVSAGRWKTAVRLRLNYSFDYSVESEKYFKEFQKLEDAIRYGQKLSKQINLPLYVSSYYLGRNETKNANLKML